MKYILITIIFGLTILANTDKKTPMMANCLIRELTGKNECLICNKGHYLKGVNCIPPKNKLEHCIYHHDDETKCEACEVGFVIEGDKCVAFDDKKGIKDDNCIANMGYDIDKTKPNKCFECKETFGIWGKELTCNAFTDKKCKKAIVLFCIEAIDDKYIAVDLTNPDPSKIPSVNEVIDKPATGFTEIENCFGYSNDKKICLTCKAKFGFSTEYKCVEDKNNPDNDKGMPGWLIALIIVGAFLLVGIIGFIIYTYFFKKKAGSKTPLV